MKFVFWTPPWVPPGGSQEGFPSVTARRGIPGGTQGSGPVPEGSPWDPGGVAMALGVGSAPARWALRTFDVGDDIPFLIAVKRSE